MNNSRSGQGGSRQTGCRRKKQAALINENAKTHGKQTHFAYQSGAIVTRRITRMGVHLRIFVRHAVQDVQLESVMRTFRPLDEVFAEVATYFSQWWPHFESPLEAWRDVSEPGSSQPYLFHAPAGFHFSFGPRVLSISHVTKFHVFCTDPDETRLLRRFAHRVVGVLGGESAIYSPDCGLGDEVYDLVHDGRTFAQIQEHLLRLGAPAATFSELAARRAPEPAYYIDDCEDSCVETTNAV
jgi:hypothetical protein